MDDTTTYRRALEALVGIPATDGNEIQILRNGDRIFPAMLDAIESAEHTVDFMTYVWWTGDICDRFAAALAGRAASGLRVRVLVDAIGGRLMDDALVERMRDAGVLFERFRPVSDLKMWRNTHRTHRRVLLVDGQVAFTGGTGIAQEWVGDARGPDEWRDTHIRIEGPAVDGLRAAFLENWAETDHDLITSDERYPALRPAGGDAPVMLVASSAGHGVSRMSILKTLLITLAQRRVRITSAYLAPELQAMRALEQATARGVEVELLVPGEHIDKRVAQVAAQQHFEDLLDIGVRIHTFEPTMLHAKTMTVDGAIADVGTANFNSRSFSQDEEVDAVVFSSDAADELDAHFDEDLERSERVTRQRWEQRGFLQRAAEQTVGLADNVM